MDDRASVILPKNFISDPWMGNQNDGRKLIDGCFRICDDPHMSIDEILRIVSFPEKFSLEIVEYASSFSWIRHIQSIGGNTNRKYVRNVILEFINFSKRRTKFWRSIQWRPDVVAERIVNMMFSFSFYASGADDKFQRLIFSIIAKQYSHISKIYNCISDQYSKILMAKAMFFFLCSSKSEHQSKIKKTLKMFCKLVNESLEEDGMYISRNPTEHFNVFRSILEIRFMARNSNIEILDDVFYKKLSSMAACLRFLRLGDGMISNHSGNSYRNPKLFIPNLNNIDTALSIVNIKDHNTTQMGGFEKIATKHNIVIINTKVSNVKSRFHLSNEPSINVFDFEASFGTERIINRGDVSVFWNKSFIKAKNTDTIFFRQTVSNNKILFVGNFNHAGRYMKFSMKRDFEVDCGFGSIQSTDTISFQLPGTIIIRFFLNKNSVITKKNPFQSLITCEHCNFSFEITDSSAKKNMMVSDSNVEKGPYIYVILRPEQDEKESFVTWKMSKI